jgi:hypothetical protein
MGVEQLSFLPLPMPRDWIGAGEISGAANGDQGSSGSRRLVREGVSFSRVRGGHLLARKANELATRHSKVARIMVTATGRCHNLWNHAVKKLRRGSPNGSRINSATVEIY